MSKDRQEQAGVLLPVEEIAQQAAARNQGEANQENEKLPDPPGPDGEKKESVEKKPAMPSKLTVDQYLKRAPQGAGVGELIRSLYRTKIMSFEEWESTVKTLLEKQVR